MKLLHDGGGIYTLGYQPGTVIRYNLVVFCGWVLSHRSDCIVPSVRLTPAYQVDTDNGQSGWYARVYGSSLG
jgi:hypothetical protein